VVPGDQLILEASILKTKRQVWQFKTTATVDGQLVAEADLMCAARKYKDD
jgi:3-hydroxyacyl-[acyl-carrier-protein] dehydratase